MTDIQITALAYTGQHERLEITEAAVAWEGLDRVLRQAGFGADQVGRDWTNQFGREYGYLHSEDGKILVVSGDHEYSSAECQQETGVSWPFGRQASGILRDNQRAEKTDGN